MAGNSPKPEYKVYELKERGGQKVQIVPREEIRPVEIKYRKRAK